ncbi:MAG TPA: hypothetical protein VIV60_22860 [Polyangiaceae bacterium]
MGQCEALEGCPFFNDKMVNMPAVAAIVKQNYCLGDHSQCARRLVRDTLGAGSVPVDLYPDQLARARQLLTAGLASEPGNRRLK